MKLDFRIPGHYTLACPLNRSMERLHADADARQFFCFFVFYHALIILMNTANANSPNEKRGPRRPSVNSAKVAFSRVRLKCFVAPPQLGWTHCGRFRVEAAN